MLIHGASTNLVRPGSLLLVENLIGVNYLPDNSIQSCRWLRNPVELKKKHGSVLIYFSDKNIANAVERGASILKVLMTKPPNIKSSLQNAIVVKLFVMLLTHAKTTPAAQNVAVVNTL
ncbi:hypothetical protein O181_111230 [Austropuccinia psidii MF-1]|uniref:Uncharacterized protein n=1 Tax=Austropuccinia psidii MF-1 TaxID=1389203 RepID=A0A9Q3JXZ5_9BASI|nr:hypothetical protein [Austropuccinia psidii MF-1]